MLELKNISVKYKNKKDYTLFNLSNKFYEKQLYAIMGSSGVGKTTLLNTICFGIKEFDGEIIFNNEKITKKNLKKFRKNISIVSQKPILIDELTVFDNLKLTICQENNIFMKTFNLITKNQKEKIFELLKEFQLLDKVFYKIKSLSGGEAQRIEIIKLFLKNKKIILMDEPTSNLDQKNAKKMIEAIKKNIIKNNAIGIINLHDQSLINENIDVVIGIKNKSIFFNEINTKNILNRLKDLYDENQ